MMQLRFACGEKRHLRSSEKPIQCEDQTEEKQPVTNVTFTHFGTIRKVFLNRLLRYINLLVAVALVVALAIVYWVVYRVLPKTSGEIHAPVSARAAVTRDALGVPHIVAPSVEDALFLQGYVTAQDRLW